MVSQVFDLHEVLDLIPRLPSSLLRTLDLYFPSTEEELKALQIQGTQCGILGAVPVGKWNKDYLVIRYFPELSTKFHICIFFTERAEGLTLSVGGDWWFFSLLCYLQDGVEYVPEEDWESLLTYFAGKGMPLAYMVEMVNFLRTNSDGAMTLRRGMAWKKLFEVSGDRFYWVLAKLWTLEMQDAHRWSLEEIAKPTAHWIVSRVRFVVGAYLHEDFDPTEILDSVLVSNDVFDATYTGVGRGNLKGAIESRASIVGIRRVLAGRAKLFVPSDVLQAWATFSANPLGYDGSSHIVTAKSAAVGKAMDKFNLLCTGLAVRARTPSVLDIPNLEFAALLAQDGGWTFASSYLDWILRQ